METINTIQIEEMKHAIGIERDRIKNYKYSAFRNYFTTPESNESWEDLVKKEYATSEKFRGIGADPKVYFVTRKGLDLLETIMFVKIIEIK